MRKGVIVECQLCHKRSRTPPRPNKDTPSRLLNRWFKRHLRIKHPEATDGAELLVIPT